MIEELYRQALAALRLHAEEAGASVREDEGELLLDGHRLGISISFEGCVQQSEHTLAPLEVQLHVDGVGGDRFRVGTLGVAPDCRGAMQSAVEEWFLLAGQPVLAALGAAVISPRRSPAMLRLARWEGFAGRTAVRGSMPAALEPGGVIYRELLGIVAGVAGGWQPQEPQLRSIFLMLTWAEGALEVQAAVDGALDPGLGEAIAALPWPQTRDAWLFKQFFVFRPREMQSLPPG